MHTVNQIRTAFLDYFQRNDHEVVTSSPLVPHNDPTLMFTNAGMVPFKNVFTGNESRDYTRATSSQKCVRAGGKHNDLDNVGYTARHHTFFEMLGNFSFGDYFKEEAIHYSWEFLTKELQLPPEKLYVTIFHTDDVAFDIWKKVSGLADERIIRIDTNDNFWAMGSVGPCGPCSEIFYDHGPEIAGGLPGTPEQDGDRYVEIWNLVFMQYEQVSEKERVDLPKPSIDTGMGLERIAAVLQGVHDNYDIDLFQRLIEASQEYSKNNDPAHLVSHRVIADHLRSSCFLLADGVMPSNEGRGYVLRRIMRRGMRHAYQLGCKEPLFHQLVPTLLEEMGKAFPELIRGQALITENLALEEERFRETLGRGLKLLDEETGGFKEGDQLSGDTAFKLYDTYGFPLDLTKDILREQNLSVDEAGFDAAMDEQKKRAKAAWAGSGEAAVEEIWFDIHNEQGGTDFLGYELETAQGNVVALVVNNEQQEAVKQGDEVAILLNQTPFYAESGGQMGDTGLLKSEGGAVIEVTDTQKKLGHLHVHLGKVTAGELKLGETVTAEVDGVRRTQLRANHSVTHLLHAVLREQLGDHVTQKGSLVAADKLRFDLSHPKAISAEEITAIEQQVNQLIRQNSLVETHVMPPEEAIKAGAMALFGEKYGDEVRVVRMGKQAEDSYSVELCGGTHVSRTGDIGLFKIVAESAVASGVRRVEALTGEAALDYMFGKEAQLIAAAEQLKSSPDEVLQRVQSLLDEKKRLEKELSDARKSAAMGGSNGGNDTEQESINGINFVGKAFDGIPAKDLRSIVEDMQKQVGSGVVLAASNCDGKAALIVGVSGDLTDRVSAVDLVRVGSDAVGGKGGGGRPDFAQAGGPDGEKVESAIEAVRKGLQEKVTGNG